MTDSLSLCATTGLRDAFVRTEFRSLLHFSPSNTSDLLAILAVSNFHRSASVVHNLVALFHDRYARVARGTSSQLALYSDLCDMFWCSCTLALVMTSKAPGEMGIAPHSRMTEPIHCCGNNDHHDANMPKRVAA